jgi:hypothetical protein
MVTILSALLVRLFTIACVAVTACVAFCLVFPNYTLISKSASLVTQPVNLYTKAFMFPRKEMFENNHPSAEFSIGLFNLSEGI